MQHSNRSKITGRFISYNRDESGRFTARRSVRAKRRNNISRAKSSTASSLRNGSLYSWRGATVRVRTLSDNGLRLVSFHNELFGFVPESELKKINTRKVTTYLTT